MHELAAVRVALDTRPETAMDLVRALPPGELDVLKIESADLSNEGHTLVQDATQCLLRKGALEAKPLTQLEQGFEVYWAADWYVVVGFLFSKRGKEDGVSPVGLLHRQRRLLVIGSEVARLANLVLGLSLAAHAHREESK